MRNQKTQYDAVLPQLYEVYRQNTYPAMVECLAEDLGVSARAIEAIGVGYDFTTASWVTPERNAAGELIGLSRRCSNGRKLTVKGSQRGLIYILNPDHDKSAKAYQPGKHNWVRASKEHPCPICGRDHWCLLSATNPDNPPAVICGDTEAGSRCKVGDNYLHILAPEGEVRGNGQTVLLNSSRPILIVEGFTDVAAATDLGFVAIGKPSASGGLAELQQMPLTGRPVVVIGENDSGAGVKGMEATYRSLRALVKDIKKLMPPEGIKDLRDWVKHGLTEEQLLTAIQDRGDSALDEEIFEDDVAHTIAKKWLTAKMMVNGWPIIRNYRGQWLRYEDGHYQEQTTESLRGELYNYLDGKLCNKEKPNGEIQLAPYKPTRSKVTDIFDALNQWCPIASDPPSWLGDEQHTAPENIIVFKNGMLDVKEYCAGRIRLFPSTPAYFSFNVLPYDFNEDLESPLWEQFVADIFSDDLRKTELLGEWMGYNCVPDMSYEKMMLFTGRPRSGKGTVLETMRALLGSNQCCETSFQSLVAQFGLAPLIGKLSALIGDSKTPRASEADTALEKILMITGGDPVTINRKGVAQLPSVHLTTRFTFAMNDLPVFTDYAQALETRLNMLHFGKSYVGREDRSLKFRLRQEAKDGKIINFALRGLKRLREQGKFTEPATSAELLNQFRNLSTPTFAFIQECCDVPEKGNIKSSDWVEKDQLYDAWKEWCARRGSRPGLKEQFGRWIVSACPGIQAERKMIGGIRRYVYFGLKLTPWACQQLLGQPGR